MAETNDYDMIFAALKHPVRRQILFLLEKKGEVSFTDIQNTVGINDTGLISYHLKELASLIEQSTRGRYRLSEIGQASVALFRKVEKEKQRANVTIRREFEKVTGEIVFLFFIVGVTLMAPLSVDIYLSVQHLSTSNFPIEQMVGMYLGSLFGMIFGVVLFFFYDWHYFSKNVKTNVIHSTIFAMGISLLSISSTYMSYRFEQASLSNSDVTWLFGILRTVSFLAVAPLTIYATNKLAKMY